MDGRGKTNSVVKLSDGVMNLGPPIEAHTMGGDAGICDPDMGDNGSNKQHVEAVRRGKGVDAVQDGLDNLAVIDGEFLAELVNNVVNVQITKGIHRCRVIIVAHRGGMKMKGRHGRGVIRQQPFAQWWWFKEEEGG